MNTIKENFTAILNKEMDRKEFLRYIAAAGLVVAGAGTLMQSLLNLDRSHKAQPTNLSASGYGASSYGGQPTRS
ncbi:MAG: hypothetical protein ABIP74_01210 [Candidatus Saccharimonas sp.]